MIDAIAGTQVTITLGDEERNVLFCLVHAETLGQVHALVTSELDAVKKTHAILGQMDFGVQMRVAVATAVPPKQLVVGDVARQYLERLIEEAREENMVSDFILQFRRVRETLLLKLGSGTGFLTSMEAAGKPAERSN